MENYITTYRRDVLGHDIHVIQRIVESSGFFSQEEVELAVELVRERLDKGRSSGYEFLFAEQGERTIGYTCFGLISCTLASYDLYWIAVDRQARGQGIGHRLLRETEEAIAALGGLRVYAETSSRAQYTPTQAFYRSCGYREEALIEDFYAPGDGKLIYCKTLPGQETSVLRTSTHDVRRVEL